MIVMISVYRTVYEHTISGECKYSIQINDLYVRAKKNRGPCDVFVLPYDTVVVL